MPSQKSSASPSRETWRNRSRQHAQVWQRCIRQAVPSTNKSAIWLLKLMIPISLIVTLLQHYGVLEQFASLLNPFFSYLGLPGTSAVIFVSGALAGTYAGIAAMTAIPLTMKQASILAVMIALCHALPMECAVNKKTGSSFWKMGILRILMALLCAAVLNIVLPQFPGHYLYMGVSSTVSLETLLSAWLVSQLKMSAMVYLIIYLLMVVQHAIEAYSLLPPLSRLLEPLMKLFGLPKQSAYMWLVGNVLGISYGSAVMLELEERGTITQEDANDVNHHLIMNHSMLEDTIVFSVTGISGLLLITTRLTAALVLVWCRRLLKRC
ncbi:MAG: nucleoside recognition domain-containing protein [Bacteroidaceae bacterium]